MSVTTNEAYGALTGTAYALKLGAARWIATAETSCSLQTEAAVKIAITLQNGRALSAVAGEETWVVRLSTVVLRLGRISRVNV